MHEYPEIWNKAKRDLTIRMKNGNEDVFLWEHSSRVAELAHHIAHLPGILLGEYDDKALILAALYHDSGWIHQCRDGSINRTEILSHPTDEVQRELGAVYLEECQKSKCPEDTLDTAMFCIRMLNSRDFELPEAQILSEALNLNEIGLLSFWNTVRRHASDGKGIQAAIDTWSRQREYRFWEARIADAFRFEPVRQIALERLRVFGTFMKELSHQNSGADLLEQIGRYAQSNPIPSA